MSSLSAACHFATSSVASAKPVRSSVDSKVAVSAALVTAEVEEAYVLSAHVALALLREIPRLQCYDTNHYIDLDKT